MNFDRTRTKQVHLSRSIKFSSVEVPDEVKYFGNKRAVVITFVFTVVLFVVIFLFTEYKEWAVRIGIFAVFFSLFKIYQVYSNPLLKLDKKGVHFQSTRVAWTRIKKLTPKLEKQGLIMEILTFDGKLIKENLQELKFHDVLSIYSSTRAFKKKYRNPYKFIK